jgi:hypothetical protein
MSLFSDWIKKIETEIEDALAAAEPIAEDVATAKSVAERLSGYVSTAEAVLPKP